MCQRSSPPPRAFRAAGFAASLALSALIAVVGPPGASARAATQAYAGDIIRMSVEDDLKPDMFVQSSNGGGQVSQYYPGPSWDSVVHVGGTAYSGNYANQTPFTPVSNTLATFAGGATITTVVDLGATGVRLTQSITYYDTTRYVTKRWQLSNNGASTYNGVKFFHGGDTTFGGDDSASGFYDAANSMVYVRNNDYANWGLMGFYANPATPASAYYEGNYWNGVMFAIAGQLPGTVDSSYQDAGYQLQWDRASLAPGQTWTIEAFETWTPAGGLQVLAPGNQNAVPGTTSTLPFTVQNLSGSPVAVTLSVSSSQGTWTPSILGSSTPTLAANSALTVNVQVAIPAGASGASTIDLTATSGAAVTGSTTLSAVNLNVSIAPASIDYGAVATGASAANTVTIQNLSGVPVQLGTLATISPFSLSADACSGVILADNASCTVQATFSPVAGGAFAANLNVPVLSPVIVTRTVPLSGSSAVVVNGACGAAQGVLTHDAPAALCSQGTPTAVGTTAVTYSWQCSGSGGTDASCSAPRGYTVSPSAGANGGIAPAAAQTVAYNGTATFTVTPAPLYGASVGGTCGGALAGTSFTTAAVTADCTVSATFGLLQQAQSIAFAALAPRTLGSGSFALSATATSGLAVGFASLTPATCTVAGGTASLVAAGTCTIRASQSGNGSWLAAADVDQSFAIGRIAQSIAFGPAPLLAAGGTARVAATGGASGQPVRFTSLTASACSVTGALVRAAAAGRCVIAADQDGNATYESAPQAALAIEAFVPPQNLSALWWDPAEPGWGLNVNHQDDIVFATLFTYARDGEPLWLVASRAEWQGDGTFRGALYRTSGPRFDQVPWPAFSIAPAGELVLRFTGNDSAVVSYTYFDGIASQAVTKTVSRMAFQPRMPTCVSTTGTRAPETNAQDLWWNAAEPGWGLNLAHQADMLFATLFTYDENGRDLWLVASALSRTPDGSYEGELLRTHVAPGFDPSRPWRGYTASVVGTMHVQFSDGETARVVYTLNGRTVDKHVTRMVYGEAVPACRY